MLHLTSHRFDEQRCLELLSNCDTIVAIYGCGGEAQQALIGGIDVRKQESMELSLLSIDANGTLS